jgi:hypothetical protein
MHCCTMTSAVITTSSTRPRRTDLLRRRYRIRTPAAELSQTQQDGFRNHGLSVVGAFEIPPQIPLHLAYT